jgi:hypothetical protein
MFAKIFILDTASLSAEGAVQISEDNEKSLLRHVPQESIYSECTIQQMDATLPSVTDIELFRQQRVNAAPLADTEAHLDVLCFPEVSFIFQIFIFKIFKIKKIGRKKVKDMNLKNAIGFSIGTIWSQSCTCSSSSKLSLYSPQVRS